MKHANLIDRLTDNLSVAQKLRLGISVLERVKARGYRFDITRWYTPGPGEPKTVDVDKSDYSEKDLVDCGSAACFAGWLAVSPEGQMLGLSRVAFSVTKPGSYDSLESVENALGITATEAEWLCCPRAYGIKLLSDQDAARVTPDMVIKRLEALIELYGGDSDD